MAYVVQEDYTAKVVAIIINSTIGVFRRGEVRLGKEALATHWTYFGNINLILCCRTKYKPWYFYTTYTNRFEKGLNTGCNRRGYFGYFSTAFRKIKKTDKQFKKKAQFIFDKSIKFLPQTILLRATRNVLWMITRLSAIDFFFFFFSLES